MPGIIMPTIFDKKKCRCSEYWEQLIDKMHTLEKSMSEHTFQFWTMIEIFLCRQNFLILGIVH